jgi:hypothetical protein
MGSAKRNIAAAAGRLDVSACDYTGIDKARAVFN